MNDIFTMQIIDGQQQLDKKFLYSMFTYLIAPLIFDENLKVTAITVLWENTEVLVLDKEKFESAYVWVPQVLDQIAFRKFHVEFTRVITV